ncbi:MAG: DUF2851 family protein [Lentisphaeria bacterium]|nr:DUF2851 family protein [Lentisphaeria bacterium]
MDGKIKYSVKKTSSGCSGIKEPPAGYEISLRSLWASLPENAEIELENAVKCIVVHPGEANTGEGPDFLNAKLRIGRKYREGDVSVHCRVSDFIRHKHISDPAYNNVILQVAQLNDLKSVPPRQLERLPLFLINGEKIRTCREKCMTAVQPEKNAEKIFPGKRTPAQKNNTAVPDKKNSNQQSVETLCPFLAGMAFEDQQKIFREAAKERMEEKAERLLNRLIAAGTEFAFKEQIFLFAGYPNNEKAFSALFVTFSHYSPEVREKDFRAVLWGESGLLPDPASAGLPEESCGYVKELWQTFWLNRTGSKLKPVWNRSGVLYGNTPEKRLAMLCLLLESFPFDPLPVLAGLLVRSGAEAFWRRIAESLDKEDLYWERYRDFYSPEKCRKRKILSDSRKITFCTDVLIPCLSAYGKLKNDPAILLETEKFFFLLPAGDRNSQIRKASGLWYDGKVWPSSAAESQGWLHIYKRNCCVLSYDCENCLLADT